MKSLDKLNLNQVAIVVKVHGSGALRRRIMDMGITKGTKISIIKTAPLGDPLQIFVRGYEVSLRKRHASLIEVSF